MRILVVEDDKVIATGLEYSLKQEGYEAVLAYTKVEASNLIKENKFDLCLLDITLPDGSGYDICKSIKQKEDIPVIFLTALDDEINVVMGLDFGADDYIAKPFRIRELMSRIRSVLRRYSKSGNESVIQVGDVEIHLMENRVYKEKKEVLLTAMEYKLLLQLVTHRGQVLTRNQLLEGIWDVQGDFVNDNTLTVYIKRLREKLEADCNNPCIIKTVRGLGYCFVK